MPWVTIGPRNEYKTFVDDEDLYIVQKYNWLYEKNRKVVLTGDGLRLSRVIMNPPTDMVVDHIDRNPLNNSRSNLRVCTQSNNAKNRRGSGVCYMPNRKKPWLAQIMYNREHIYIGYFHTEDEARAAAHAKKLELFGEFTIKEQNDGTDSRET